MTSLNKNNQFVIAHQGFTLLETLISMAIVITVASAGAVGIGLSAAAQEDARLSQLAMQAAKQQVDFLMEQPFASMAASVGIKTLQPPYNKATEEVAQMKAPPAAGGVDRTLILGGEWAKLGRRTTLTSEPTTFTQYNNF